MFIRRLFTATALLTAVALPTITSAQEIGVKAGVNFATIASLEEDFPDSKQRLGPIGGLFVTVPATERFSFQIEGLYSEKGLATEAVATGVDLEEIELQGDIRLRYLEVPILARTDFGASGSSANVYLVAGAAPAFKLGARLKIEADGDEETEDISDEIESFDLGLVAGAGVEFGNALVEARYTHGLRSLVTSDDDGDDEDVRNRVFSVMVGYRFR